MRFILKRPINAFARRVKVLITFLVGCRACAAIQQERFTVPLRVTSGDELTAARVARTFNARIPRQNLLAAENGFTQTQTINNSLRCHLATS